MAASRSEHRLAAARSAGVALAVVPLLVPLLPRGGLAPIAVAAGVALLLGAPAAVAEWRTPLPHPDTAERGRAGSEAALRAAVCSSAEVAGLLLVAGALAAVAHTGSVGALLAAGAWIAGPLVAPRGGWAAVPAAVGLGAIGAATVLDLGAAPPWTLLDPQWQALPDTAGAALVAGVLFAGAGTGHWTLGPPRPPGDRFAPWAAAGVGLAALALLVASAGARFEAARGDPGPSLAVTVGTALALVSATAAIAGRPGPPRDTALRIGAGLALTLALAGPAWEVRPWLIVALAPLAAAFCLGVTAMRAGGSDRMVTGASAAVLLGAAAAAWPGLPDRTVDAVAIGLAGVAAFWFVATRSALARRTA